VCLYQPSLLYLSLSHKFLIKPTIYYIDLIVLLESLDLTALLEYLVRYIKSQRGLDRNYRNPSRSVGLALKLVHKLRSQRFVRLFVSIRMQNDNIQKLEVGALLNVIKLHKMARTTGARLFTILYIFPLFTPI